MSRPACRGVVLGAAAALAVTAALAGSAAAGPAGTTSDPGSDAVRATGVDAAEAIVQLSLAPLATSPRTKPSPGKKIDYSSATTKNERARLSAQRNDFKKWLQSVAPKAKVNGEYDIAVNAIAVTLNGTPLATLSGGPGVISASYAARYTTTDAADPDLPLVRAIEAWQGLAGGGTPGANAGTGVKVGVIDSGIDATHPCFDGAGYPKFTGAAGDVRFTSPKVVVAKVFHMNAKQKGYTPAAIDSHGTHVAGTIACELNTPASVDGVAIGYAISGVAPAAQLGNYNVFPADEANARSEDILDALQAAAEDGMDVLNMSLGGNAHGVQDLLTTAVDNLDQANIVVAVANGNEGPGHLTVGSPGSAARALSAGASTVGHFVGLPLTVGGTTYRTATGELAIPAAPLTAPLRAALAAGALSTACSTAPPAAGSLAGAIAVISRGGCTFSEKVRNAQTAGALAVVVVNNVAGDPTAMASDGTANQPVVPAVMAGLVNRAALLAASGSSATLGATASYAQTGNDDIMAGFSSQGPTDVDFRVKPDVVAPGVNVLSSVPANACPSAPCFAFFSGTSMATPHLAGVSALVRQARPAWTAEQVRSAIVNTATQGVLTSFADGTTTVRDVNIVGAGKADTVAAIAAKVALGPVSTSFGAVPSGSGQTLRSSVTLTNLTSGALTLALSVDPGGPFSVGPAPVSLAAGASAPVPVTLTLAKGAAAGDVQSFLRVRSGGVEIAHSALYVLVK
jgi:subtilisin family serine protease